MGEEILTGSFLDELPPRLIGDKVYDSDRMDQKLEEDYGVEMSAPTAAIGPRARMADRCAVKRSAGKWAAFRLDAQLPQTRKPMGIRHHKLPWNGPSRLPQNDA